MDQKLLDRVRAGDKNAFAQLYHELKQPVFVIVSRIVRSEAMAEDVTQDVFVKLYASPPDPSVKNPRAWIFRMARNLAIDTLRKQRDIALDDVDIPSMDPTEGIHTRLDLETAIWRLPQCERELLSLHLNAELPFREIARIVGLTLPAAYRKYRRALKALRDILNGGAL